MRTRYARKVNSKRIKKRRNKTFKRCKLKTQKGG